MYILLIHANSRTNIHNILKITCLCQFLCRKKLLKMYFEIHEHWYNMHVDLVLLSRILHLLESFVRSYVKCCQTSLSRFLPVKLGTELVLHLGKAITLFTCKTIFHPLCVAAQPQKTSVTIRIQKACSGASWLPGSAWRLRRHYNF